jgi:hypothetical protein
MVGPVKATVVQRRVILVDDRHKDWFAFCKGFQPERHRRIRDRVHGLGADTDRSLLLATATTRNEAASHYRELPVGAKKRPIPEEMVSHGILGKQDGVWVF